MLRISIFTDCRDSNAIARQQLRYGALFPDAETHIYGASSAIEVSGCVVDALDAVRANASGQNIIIGNVAPRTEKRHKNGAPFCFSRASDNVLIIGTPTTFVMPLKLGLIGDVYKTDVQTVCEQFLPSGVCNTEPAERITTSQFRSYDYVPRLAQWLWEKEKKVMCRKTNINPDQFNGKIYWIDCFGNAKIFSLKHDIEHARKKGFISCKGKKLPFYEFLSKVPKGETAVIVGSSGYYDGEDHRFLEIVKQGGNAAQELGLSVGDLIV